VDSLERLFIAVRDTVAGMLENVAVAFGNISNAIKEWIFGAVGLVVEGVSQVAGGILRVVAGVQQQLGDAVGALADLLGQAVTNIPGALVAGIANILARIPSMEDVAAFLLEMLEVIWSNSGERIQGWLETRLPVVARRLSESGEAILGLELPAPLRALLSDGRLPLWARQMLPLGEGPQRPIQLLAIVGFLVSAGFVLAAPAMEPVGNVLRQLAYTAMPTKRPDAASLIQWRFRMPEEEFMFGLIMRQEGYDTSWQHRMMEVHRPRLPASAYVEAIQRQEEHPSSLVEELRQLGMRDSDIALAQQLAKQQVPLSDLITMVGREAFEEEQAQALELDAEFDTLSPDFFIRLEKLGIDKETAKYYWRAHWALPAPGQVFEMFHRKIIKDTEVESYLKAHELTPYWRRKVIDLSYRPLTRVDTRRAHKIGELGPDQVTKSYLDQGYSPENAEILTRFTIALNEEDEQDQIETVRGPIKTQVLRSYTERIIDKAEAGELLKSLGYTDVQRQWLIAQGDYDIAADEARTYLTAAKSGYVRGLRDGAATGEILARGGFNSGAIGRLLTLWAPERENRELTEAEANQRDLSKAEVLAAYESNVIEPARAETLLGALGFDSGEVATLLALADLKVRKAALAVIKDSVRVRYVASRLSRAEAASELDAAGVLSKERDSLLARWDVEREQRIADIPLSTLEKLLSENLYTALDVQEELRQQGYSEKQTGALVALWGK
jgi:hypothetical protein